MWKCMNQTIKQAARASYSPPYKCLWKLASYPFHLLPLCPSLPGPCVMCDLMEALAIVIEDGEAQFTFRFLKTFTDSQKRLVGLYCKDVYVPYSFTIFIPFTWITLFHAKPIALELLKSQLTACIEQALCLLAVKTFFVQHSNFFWAALTIFSAELIAVYCFGQLGPVYKNNALLWGFWWQVLQCNHRTLSQLQLFNA